MAIGVEKGDFMSNAMKRKRAADMLLKLARWRIIERKGRVEWMDSRRAISWVRWLKTEDMYRILEKEGFVWCERRKLWTDIETREYENPMPKSLSMFKDYE